MNYEYVGPPMSFLRDRQTLCKLLYNNKSNVLHVTKQSYGLCKVVSHEEDDRVACDISFTKSAQIE